MTSISTTRAPGRAPLAAGARMIALSVAAVGIVFPIGNYLIFWQGWPGLSGLLAGTGGLLGWMHLLLYAVPVAAVVAHVLRGGSATLTSDGGSLVAIAMFIARAAFWAVLLVGLADMVISFLRVEGYLQGFVGEALAQDLGRARFRGTYVHYPLIGVSLVVALLSRSIGFTWLSLLIVIAEFQIVIARFIFSYEQAFMGDLVRFWYAALFLFASAYTLIEEGHVRVDILYTTLSERGKAWSNTIGTALLGVPICWVILVMGMWEKSNLINAPLLSFEVSQSGFGMYVKYLMAAFLMVYALSMMVMFLGFFLRNVAVLMNDDDALPVGISGQGH